MLFPIFRSKNRHVHQVAADHQDQKRGDAKAVVQSKCGKEKQGQEGKDTADKHPDGVMERKLHSGEFSVERR